MVRNSWEKAHPVIGLTWLEAWGPMPQAIVQSPKTRAQNPNPFESVTMVKHIKADET
jgi:hypothetical protein